MNKTLTAVSSCYSWHSGHYCQQKLRNTSTNHKKPIKHCSQINVSGNIRFTKKRDARNVKRRPTSAVDKRQVTSAEYVRPLNYWRFVAPLKKSSRTYLTRLRKDTPQDDDVTSKTTSVSLPICAPLPFTPNNTIIATTDRSSSSSCSHADDDVTRLSTEDAQAVTEDEFETTHHSTVNVVSRNKAGRAARATRPIVTLLETDSRLKTKAQLLRDLHSRIALLPARRPLDPATNDVNRLAHELRDRLGRCSGRLFPDVPPTPERSLPKIMDAFVKARDQQQEEETLMYRLQRLPRITSSYSTGKKHQQTPAAVQSSSLRSQYSSTYVCESMNNSYAMRDNRVAFAD